MRIAFYPISFFVGRLVSIRLRNAKKPRMLRGFLA
jgi:hypothetical protein